MLGKLAVDFKGIISEPVLRGKKVIGYGLRMIGYTDLHIFAHVDICSDQRLGDFGIDLTPFDMAADYIEKIMAHHPQLFVIDEIGVVEHAARCYKRAINRVLDSPVPTLFVVQKRSSFLAECQKRDDVVLFELLDNSFVLEQHLFGLLKEITDTDSRIHGKGRCRQKV